ncbi:MAG: hypothetical protein Q8L84_01770 [Hyphomonas sp.]|nr:hypothetical protein [Hyphomonas sp.]
MNTPSEFVEQAPNLKVDKGHPLLHPFAKNYGGVGEMWTILTEGPPKACEAIKSLGIECSASVVAINLWQTAIIVGVFLLVAGLAHLIGRFQRLDTHRMAFNLVAPHRALDEKKVLKLHPVQMANLLGHKKWISIGNAKLSKKLNDAYSKRYFIVEFREAGRRLYRGEAKLVPVWQHTQEREIRIDLDTMRALNLGSNSTLDDNTPDLL